MLEIVVPLDSMHATLTAQRCLELLEAERGSPVATINLYHVPVKPAALARMLKTRRAFHLDGPDFDVHLASVKNYRLGFLSVDGIKPGAESSWVIILGRNDLIMARLYDKQFDFWQNAEDPLEFKTLGRSIEGLQMKSNDLPPPLDQMIVCTSRNPGRRILRDGYLEAIGHKMWLGPEFFQRVPGTSRETVTSASWLTVTECPNGVLELVAQEEPFVNESTADLQNRLRRLLFPTTADGG